MGNIAMERTHLILDPIISEAYQDEVTSGGKEEFLRKVAYQILQKGGYKFRSILPTPVEKLRVLLGMNLTSSKDLFGDARSIKTEDTWRIELAADQVYFDGSRHWLTERGRFSLAHEIGHFILLYIQEKFRGIAEELRFEEKNIEEVCDFLSSELLLPSCIFERTSMKDILKIGKEKPPCPERSLLTIGLLETLRRSLRVSRITLIRKLNRTPLLDDAQCGIVISMFSVNRNTGRSPGLRVYRASVPSWGFIPQNIRLSKIGLDSALYVFNGLKYGKPQEWKGRVKVSEKDEAGTRGRWVSRFIESWGEHALYPFAEQQNYLITTFGWERPEQSSNRRV